MEDKIKQYVPLVGIFAAGREFKKEYDNWDIVEAKSSEDAFRAASNYVRGLSIASENLAFVSGLAYLVLR